MAADNTASSSHISVCLYLSKRESFGICDGLFLVARFVGNPASSRADATNCDAFARAVRRRIDKSSADELTGGADENQSSNGTLPLRPKCARDMEASSKCVHRGSWRWHIRSPYELWGCHITVFDPKRQQQYETRADLHTFRKDLTHDTH